MTDSRLGLGQSFCIICFWNEEAWILACFQVSVVCQKKVSFFFYSISKISFSMLFPLWNCDRYSYALLSAQPYTWRQIKIVCSTKLKAKKKQRNLLPTNLFALEQVIFGLFCTIWAGKKKPLKNMSFYLTKASSCEWIRISQKSLCMWNIFERKYVYHLLYWFPYGAACQSTLCSRSLLLVQKFEIRRLPIWDSTLSYQSLVFSKLDSNQSLKVVFMTLNLNSEMFCYTLFVEKLVWNSLLSDF